MPSWKRLHIDIKALTPKPIFNASNALYTHPCNQVNWKTHYTAAKALRALVAKGSGSEGAQNSTEVQKDYLVKVFPKVFKVYSPPVQKVTWKSLPKIVSNLQPLPKFSTYQDAWASLPATKNAWPSKQQKRADALKSLVNKACGGDRKNYLEKLFHKIEFGNDKYENCVENIVKELDDKVTTLIFFFYKCIVISSDLFIFL